MGVEQGLFIVLEGVDGAGTTTLSRRLGEALLAMGLPARVTQEPSEGPVGSLLRLVLGGRLGVRGLSGVMRPPHWRTMALMFAADRADHVESVIVPNLREGVYVVCDRYYHSSLAYQSTTGQQSEEAIEWIRQINAAARRPDLTIVLDVSPEVAQQRRHGRGVGELYDGAELQRQLCEFYRTLDRHLPEERIVHVNADGPVEEVAQQVLMHVHTLR